MSPLLHPCNHVSSSTYKYTLHMHRCACHCTHVPYICIHMSLSVTAHSYPFVSQHLQCSIQHVMHAFFRHAHTCPHCAHTCIMLYDYVRHRDSPHLDTWTPQIQRVSSPFLGAGLVWSPHILLSLFRGTAMAHHLGSNPALAWVVTPTSLS